MSDFRADIRDALSNLLSNPSAATQHLTPDTVWDVAWPVNRLVGPHAVEAGYLAPLRAALAHVYRRDVLFLGGDNIREQGGQWCACVTHYVGNFHAPLFGLQPSGSMTWLRSGEFYRIEGGKIAEAKIIFDLVSVMQQMGRQPIDQTGPEITFPAPATQDGLCPTGGDSARSIDIVNRMLGDLHVFDPETMESKGQTGSDGVWADDMMWYGPTGIGSNYRWDGFVQDHRQPFLQAFPDRKGGNHYCRFGDANYAAISGWPSMTMTFQGDYLGQKADGRPLTLRVMDFYRCDERQIKENWVCLDYGDLFHQMGRDLIAEANAMA